MQSKDNHGLWINQIYYLYHMRGSLSTVRHFTVLHQTALLSWTGVSCEALHLQGVSSQLWLSLEQSPFTWPALVLLLCAELLFYYWSAFVTDLLLLSWVLCLVWPCSADEGWCCWPEWVSRGMQWGWITAMASFELQPSGGLRICNSAIKYRGWTRGPSCL